MMPVTAIRRKPPDPPTLEYRPMRTAHIVLLSFTLLAACSPPDKAPKIAEDQRKVLDQAKAVSADMAAQAEAQRKQLEQQEQ